MKKKYIIGIIVIAIVAILAAVITSVVVNKENKEKTLAEQLKSPQVQAEITGQSVKQVEKQQQQEQAQQEQDANKTQAQIDRPEKYTAETTKTKVNNLQEYMFKFVRYGLLPDQQLYYFHESPIAKTQITSSNQGFFSTEKDTKTYEANTKLLSEQFNTIIKELMPMLTEKYQTELKDAVDYLNSTGVNNFIQYNMKQLGNLNQYTPLQIKNYKIALQGEALTYFIGMIQQLSNDPFANISDLKSGMTMNGLANPIGGGM